MSMDMSQPPKPTGYLLLFRNTNWSSRISEDETKKAMERVASWLDGLAASGKMVSGQPLFDDEAVVISGKGGTVITDGPFAEAKEVIGGYILLNVETMEEAVAIAKTNPMHDFGLSTEVRVTASTCPHVYYALQKMAEAVA